MNSPHLPVARTLFNLHRAKAHDTAIIVESALDVMRLHQAGYPNAVALLHGHINERHFQLLGRYFSGIVIMSDYDSLQRDAPCRKCIRNGLGACQGHNPGRDLGVQIARGMSHKRVSWAVCGDRMVYPTQPLTGYRNGPAKDPGDLTDAEIHRAVKGAVPHFEYIDWLRDGSGYGRVYQWA